MRNVTVIEAVRWTPDRSAVRIIDQRLLPERYEERDLRSLDDVCDAITTLAVRGAPAIGVAGAMGLAASLLAHVRDTNAEFRARLAANAERIRATRPTAVNLPWTLDRMLVRAPSSQLGNQRLLELLFDEATAILDEDRAMCRRIGEHGLALLHDGARVLTHCNAGALATAGIGTAMAPVYLAAERGWSIEVLADETRPLLQGSRLTAWELSRAGIPVRVIADGAAASMMARGLVDMVIVGADRIAANGDVANKIGSYGLAIAARHHGIPFYVAAPSSTLDRTLPNGGAIHVEQRHRDELARSFGTLTIPDGVPVENPAFDITPAELVTSIVTDQGVWRPPFNFMDSTLGIRYSGVVSAERQVPGAESRLV